MTTSLPLRLVIGYGNTIRQDDGVGYRLAECLGTQPPTLSFCQLKAIAVHQLTLDLAAEVAQATEVIFVDMMLAPYSEAPYSEAQDPEAPQVQLQRLTPSGMQGSLGHISSPHSILHLSDRLFGTTPQGYWLLIPGVWSNLGEDLSPLAQQGFAQALAIVQNPILL